MFETRRNLYLLGVVLMSVILVMASTHLSAAEARKDVIITVKDAGSFKTLIKALDAAGLTETLKGPGPFTIFAPTDAAFDKLPEGKLDSLLKPENRNELVAILNYHVVPGRLNVAKVSDMPRLRTLQGSDLMVVSRGKGVTVGGARITETDVMAGNGVIHVIDTVLTPARPRTTHGSAPEARRMIATAIEKGGPMYTNGNYEKCAAVYEKACRSLLKDFPDALNEGARKRLRNSMTESRAEQDPRKRAWILRQALDDVHTSLKKTERQAPKKEQKPKGER